MLWQSAEASDEHQCLPDNGLFVRELLGRLAGQVVNSCYDGLLELQLNWRWVLSSVQSLFPRCFGESFLRGAETLCPQVCRKMLSSANSLLPHLLVLLLNPHFRTLDNLSGISFQLSFRMLVLSLCRNIMIPGCTLALFRLLAKIQFEANLD